MLAIFILSVHAITFIVCVLFLFFVLLGLISTRIRQSFPVIASAIINSRLCSQFSSINRRMKAKNLQQFRQIFEPHFFWEPYRE